MAVQLDWTLLIYLAADNNLGKKADQLLGELQHYARSAKLRIVVAHDKSGQNTTYHDLYGGHLQTTITVNTLGDFGSPAPLYALLEYAARDPFTADATFATFADFVEASLQSEPHTLAQSGLIIWNHGGGWDQVASDTGGPSPSRLSVLEVQSALNGSALPRLSFIGFDACLTSTLEVLAQLKTNTDVIISSQALSPASGWDYADLVTKLSAPTAPKPYDLAQSIVQGFLKKNTKGVGHGTLVAFDMTKLDTLLDEFSKLAAAVTRSAAGSSLDTLRAKVLTMYNPEYVDLGSLIEAFEAEFPTISTDDIVRALADVFVVAQPLGSTPSRRGPAKAIFGARNGNKSGLSVYYPKYKSLTLANYLTTTQPPPLQALSIAASWKNFLAAHVVKTLKPPMPIP